MYGMLHVPLVMRENVSCTFNSMIFSFNVSFVRGNTYPTYGMIGSEPEQVSTHVAITCMCCIMFLGCLNQLAPWHDTWRQSVFVPSICDNTTHWSLSPSGNRQLWNCFQWWGCLWPAATAHDDHLVFTHHWFCQEVLNVWIANCPRCPLGGHWKPLHVSEGKLEVGTGEFNTWTFAFHLETPPLSWVGLRLLVTEVLLTDLDPMGFGSSALRQCMIEMVLTLLAHHWWYNTCMPLALSGDGEHLDTPGRQLVEWRIIFGFWAM